MNVETTLKVNKFNAQTVNIVSADISSLNVGGSELASKDFVLDVVALASRYAVKQLNSSDLSLDMFTMNRTPLLTAGQQLTVIAPEPLSGNVIDWQMITDLTNLSSSETAAMITVAPPTGYTFNWQYIDGNTALTNQKKFLTIYQAVPLSGNTYDIICCTKELKDS